MESDRRLNRWGLTFTPTVINRLRKLAIYGQPQLSLEHQGRAKRYVVRGVESGGATEEVGYYVSFAGENGEPLPWLQTLDSLTVNGPHAVVIAPVLTRIEMLRVARTYELCITRHRPVAVETRQRPKLEAEEVFRAKHGYLALELWGKDKELSGCVRPQFFTRSGEEVELPSRVRRGGEGCYARCELCGLFTSTLLAARGATTTTTTGPRRRTRTRNVRGYRVPSAGSLSGKEIA